MLALVVLVVIVVYIVGDVCIRMLVIRAVLNYNLVVYGGWECHKIVQKMGPENREKWPGGMGVLQKDFSGHTETRLDFDPKIVFFRRVAENEGLV